MKKIDKLKAAKEIKLKELREIEAAIEAEENGEFQYLVGKFVKLATTCVIRVDEINYCDSYHVHICGLKILSCDEELRIEISGSESFDKTVKPKEITKEQFLEFMGQSIAMLESKALSVLEFKI